MGSLCRSLVYKMEQLLKARSEDMTGYRRLISYIYAYEGEEKGKNIAVINIYYLYISNDMYVIIKIHLWHNRD